MKKRTPKHPTAGSLRPVNLARITGGISADSAADFYKWHEDFVIKGN